MVVSHLAAFGLLGMTKAMLARQIREDVRSLHLVISSYWSVSFVLKSFSVMLIAQRLSRLARTV